MFIHNAFIIQVAFLLALLVLCVPLGAMGRRLLGGGSDAQVDRTVIWVGIAWTLFCTAVYWALGPYSVFGRSDEYDIVVPWVRYLTHTYPGGGFAGAWSGGVDATGSVAAATQWLSFERVLFAIAPLWIALWVMKAGTIAISYAGGYVLGRRALGLDRWPAVTIGLVASAHIYNYGWAAGALGFSTALLPWIWYAMNYRLDRPRYFLTVALVALLYSASTSVVHTLPGLVVAMLAAAIISPPARQGRWIAAGFLFAGICALNYLPVIHAVLQLAPESARGFVAPVRLSLGEVLAGNEDVIALPIATVSLILLFAKRDALALRATMALLVAVCSGWLIQLVPWHAMGIDLLNWYRWDLLLHDYLLVVLLVLGRALTHFEWRAPGTLKLFPVPVLAGYFAAVPVSYAVYQEAINVVTYRTYGGQALFSQLGCLRNRSWQAKEPYRFVTIPGLMSPNITNAYGVETYDGSANSFTQRQSLYFGLAVQRPARRLTNTRNNWLPIPKPGAALGDSVNLDALRIANVRYVVTDRSLSDSTFGGRAPVCAREQQPLFPPSVTRLLERVSPRAGVPAHQVLELSDAWPRVFVPRGVSISQRAIDDPLFYQEIVASSRDRMAHVSFADATVLKQWTPPTEPLVIDSVRETDDGYDISVRSSGTAAVHGVIGINLPYSRWWRATSGARDLPVVPANGVQMLVLVDGEKPTEPIEVRYARPKLLGR